MRFIKSIKRETRIIAIGVILLTVSSLGFSYSAIFEIKSNTNNQIIETGSLSVAYGSSSSAINDLEMLPKSDEDGLDGESSSIIYIQNNSTLDSAFTITISYDYSSFRSREDYQEKDELIPFEYLKMAIFEYNPVTTSMELVSSVIDLGDVPIFKVGGEYYSNSYAVYNSTVDKASSGNSTKTFAVKIWIDEDAPNEASGYFVFLNVNVESEVKAAVMNYNFNGTVRKDFFQVPSAVVELQNSAFKTTTNESGEFTLSGIREGVYLIKIIHEDVVYSTTFTLIEGDYNDLYSYSSDYQVAAGETLSKVVNKHGTTFKRFLGANNIINDTMSYQIEVGNYAVPNSFVIVGGSDINLREVDIFLNTENGPEIYMAEPK